LLEGLGAQLECAKDTLRVVGIKAHVEFIGAKRAQGSSAHIGVSQWVSPGHFTEKLFSRLWSCKSVEPVGLVQKDKIRTGERFETINPATTVQTYKHRAEIYCKSLTMELPT
jgi:hypothetical protein